MIRIIDTGVIYQNPLPGIRSIYANFPGLVRLSDNEILCVYSRASASMALDRRYACTRSQDGGKTWNDEGILWDGRADKRQYSYGYGYPAQLDNGELLVAGYRWDRSDSDADYNIYNPETMGGVPLETVLFRSSDRGHTWSGPQVVALPKEIPMANATGRVVALSNGRLLLPIETWQPWDKKGTDSQQSIALFSSDRGYSWDQHVVVARQENILHWNGMFTSLGDGRVLAMYWIKDAVAEKDLPVRATFSQDQGQTWARPYDTGIIGQMGCSIDIGDGRVLAVYNRRDEQSPGIWAVVSADHGRTWPESGHLLVWDARGRDIYGSTGDDNRSRSIYDEGLMAFGKPDAVELADGTLLIGFWCTSNLVVHIRYARLAVG